MIGKPSLLRSRVAPRAGAWIETRTDSGITPAATSLPARERGLKQMRIDLAALVFWSLPARERGLKHAAEIHAPWIDVVAPRAGAWIETGTPTPKRPIPIVAPRAGAWIETCHLWRKQCSRPGRSPRGSVD